jgi:hypothetical protein
LSFYSYVNGDPVSLTDPLGLAPFCSAWKQFKPAEEREEKSIETSIKELGRFPAAFATGLEPDLSPPKRGRTTRPGITRDWYMYAAMEETTEEYLVRYLVWNLWRTCSDFREKQTCDGTVREQYSWDDNEEKKSGPLSKRLINASTRRFTKRLYKINF